MDQLEDLLTKQAGLWLTLPFFGKYKQIFLKNSQSWINADLDFITQVSLLTI